MKEIGDRGVGRLIHAGRLHPSPAKLFSSSVRMPTAYSPARRQNRNRGPLPCDTDTCRIKSMVMAATSLGGSELTEWSGALGYRIPVPDITVVSSIASQMYQCDGKPSPLSRGCLRLKIHKPNRPVVWKAEMEKPLFCSRLMPERPPQGEYWRCDWRLESVV